MSVDRPDVIEAELLKQRAPRHVAARMLDRSGDRAVPALGQALGELLADIAQLEIGAAGAETREIGRHGADRRRNRHVVVIENDDEAFVARAGVVHGLSLIHISEPTRQAEISYAVF